MIYNQKIPPILFKKQRFDIAGLMSVNKQLRPFFIFGKNEFLKIFLALMLTVISQLVTQAQVKMTRVTRQNNALKSAVATPIVTKKNSDASSMVVDKNFKRINTSSIGALKKDFFALREGEYSVVSLQLPGNSKKSDYYVKKWGTKLILDGDIIVKDLAVLSTKSYSKDDNNPLFGKNNLYRWPGGDVPVMLDNSVFETGSYDVIKSAFNYFNFNTGIVFKERTNEEDYVYIAVIEDDKSGRGGASYVGRQRGGSNALVLIKGKFLEGTVLHELMHALGIYHEQARPDRDFYVDILWDNIREDAKHDFQVENDGTIRSNYDYCSIMHYPYMAFSNTTGAITITCKANGMAIPCPACMGTQTTLTKMDLDGLDKLYGGIGVSRFPSKMPFVYSKVPIAGCIGVDDKLIKAKWEYYKNALGDCQTKVISKGISATTYVQFERGVIYHSPHGVFAVYGDIYQLFKTQHVGFPLTDENDLTDADHSWNKVGYTRISKFEKGVIIWGPNKKAMVLTNEKFAKGPFVHGFSIDTKVVPLKRQKPRSSLILKKK